MAMEAAQVGEHDRSEKTEAVVPREIVEARMEARARGYAERLRRTQRGVAERPLGRNVDRVGTFLLPQIAQAACGRQAELQTRVARQARAAHQHVVAVGAVFVNIHLARTYDLYRMPGFAQAVDQAGHGQCHAVDFRRKGLGDHGDAHAGTPRVYATLVLRLEWRVTAMLRGGYSALNA